MWKSAAISSNHSRRFDQQSPELEQNGIIPLFAGLRTVQGHCYRWRAPAFVDRVRLGVCHLCDGSQSVQTCRRERSLSTRTSDLRLQVCPVRWHRYRSQSGGARWGPEQQLILSAAFAALEFFRSPINTPKSNREPTSFNGHSIPQPANNQVAFATASTSDRITFACWRRRNRTAHMPSGEKGRKPRSGIQKPIFSSPVSEREPAELRPFHAIFRGTLAVFSARQTEWRRERDSNPRYPFGYAGFQDRCHQPLGHLSAARSPNILRFYGTGPVLVAGVGVCGPAADATAGETGDDGGAVISMAQMAAGRMYIDARKLPSISYASGVRNQ
jgi:hypothetical protein